MNHLLRSLALVSLMLAIIGWANAQTVEPDSFATGRVYVLAFPDTVGNERDALFPDTRFNDAAVVMIYSAIPNTVTITGGNGLAKWTGKLAPGVMTTIDLMRPEFRDPFGPVSPTPSVQRKNALRLVTEHPVVLHCYMMTTWGMEAWTPLPVEAWGNEYFAAGFPGDVVRNVFYVVGSMRTRAQAAPSEIVLIAAYDNTQIAVYANGPVLDPPSIITLHANEAFQLRSFVDTMARVDAPQSDLAGSYIVSSRPIGVITGNSRTAVIDERSGLTKNSMKGMAIEWLTPTDLHGRQMVVMPAADELAVTGGKNEQLAQKRPGEILRVYGTTRDSTSGMLSSPVEAPRSILVSRTQAQSIRLDGQQSARYLETSAPVQAMISPAAVIRSAVGGGYDAWAPYMVELVPREQWTSFAPFFAPQFPTGMRHYLNIVTDTIAINDIFIDGRLFRFNRGTIAGTDLIWGTMEVPVEYQHRIEGRNGAKFSAMIYGLLGGSEKTINKTYREYLALSYGYALGASRRALRLRDTLIVDSVSDCAGITVDITSVAQRAATVRRVWLDSASNLRLLSAPAFTGPVITPVTLRVEAIDARADSRGVLHVEDRAGIVRTLALSRAAEVAAIEPSSGVLFGEAMSGDTISRTFTVRNFSSVAIPVRSVRIASGSAMFAIDDTISGRLLEAGESVTLSVRALPVGRVGVISDSIRVSLGCSEMRIPLAVSIVEPCIEMGDLDFGSVAPGSLATRSLTVCNRGRGRLQLLGTAGDSTIVWSDPAFMVNPVFQELLRASTLGPSECATIEVFFSSSRAGRYRTVAQMEPSAGSCRDSSVWTATVTPTTGVASDGEIAAMSVEIDDVDRIVTITARVDRTGPVSLVVYDAVGRAVACPFDGEARAGSHRVRWNASGAPTGVYYVSFTSGGGARVQRFALGR